jgi:protein gp37
MALAQRHTFQVLTKRPRRLAVMLADPGFERKVGEAATEIIGRTPHGVWRMDMTGWALEGPKAGGRLLDGRTWDQYPV